MSDVEGSKKEASGQRDRSALLRSEDAAKRIGVSPRTMRRMIAQRKIRHLRVGRLTRVYSSDVEEFVANAIIEPVPE